VRRFFAAFVFLFLSLPSSREKPKTKAAKKRRTPDHMTGS
jgi:hypothetical protein